MIDVSLVIVTYKEHPDVLRACFDAVAASRDVTVETIVVDNGGSEATKTLLAEVLPGAQYAPNPQNRGFAAAVNQGMRVAQCRYVLLLNPDTVIPDDALARMVRHMDRDTDVGIASAVIRYPDGRLQESIRRFPTLIDQVLILLKAPHVVRRLPWVDHYMMRDADPLATQDVDSIMGAFMMIRREVIDRIGMFDERYFIWFEEVDYCKMARDAGFRVRHYGDVAIVHHKGHTFDQLATIRKQRWVRESMRKYMAKHHGAATAAIFWVLAPMFIVLAYLAAFMKKG
ncbi:glycosyltransferase family 2 protein [Candidatus Uhrbacteria bacterium]|nr:glycosyltransferase family 2 protein [Candidatus Uhrbacteria bacterium]